jgi:hypothetical protein
MLRSQSLYMTPVLRPRYALREVRSMPRTPTYDVTVETLHRYLRHSVRRGARASRLLQHVPEIVDLLYPPADYPHLSNFERALSVETDIRHVIDHDIGGPHGEAIATVLCLRSGTVGRTLDDRRRIAATFLNIDAQTFRRARHEGALLFDLAFQIHHRHTTHKPQQPSNH